MPWEEAPDWQKESCVEGMKAHMHDPYMTPADSHASWLEHKKSEGWTYGPEKNADKKEHPCMVPYGELPPEQRTKDYLFKAVADALREHVELDPDDVADFDSCLKFSLGAAPSAGVSNEEVFVHERVRRGLDEWLRREKVPKDLNTVGRRRRDEVRRLAAEEIERLGKKARAEWKNISGRRYESNLFG